MLVIWLIHVGLGLETGIHDLEQKMRDRLQALSSQSAV